MKILKTSYIDSLSKVQRLVAWAGLCLVAVLVVALASALIGDSFGWSEAIPFWVIMTASGYWGSEYRSRKKRS